MKTTKPLIIRLANLSLAVVLILATQGLPLAFAANPPSLSGHSPFHLSDQLPAVEGLLHFGNLAVPQIDHVSTASSPATAANRLAAGAPQTVTVQVTPATLIANSGSTATITATVVDADNLPVSGVTLSGSLSPASLGNVNMPDPTDANGEAVGTWTAGTSVGSGELSLTEGSVTGTATVTLTVGALADIAVAPNPTTVTVGLTRTFTASGFDQYGNPVAITPNWTTNSAGSTIDAKGIFTASTSVQSGRRVTATEGLIANSVIVNIVAGPLANIIVSPGSVAMTVGTTRTFTADGSDQYGNPVVITPTWTTNSPGSIINAKGVFTASTSVQSGRRVTATQGLVADSATVDIVAGEPAVLTIWPATPSVPAGTRITYTAVASDTFGNSLGNVTAGTVFNIAPASGGTFAANVVTPTIKGTYTITGQYASLIDTAILIVNPATFFRLSIEDAPAGSGQPIGATALSIYQTLTAYAVGYDQFNNLISARSVTWGATGVLNGHLSPTSGISTTLTPGLSGTGLITATSNGITDTTGVITIQAPVLQISKTDDPDPVTPGDILQYTIVYTNASNVDAQNVVITETYPLSVTYQSSFSNPSLGAPNNNNVWQVGNLVAGSSGSIVVYVKLANQFPVGSVLTNTVRIAGAKAATAIDTATTAVNAVPNVNVTLSDNPDPARVNGTFTYLMQYSNNGTAPVSGVRVTNTFPSQVSFVSSNPAPDINSPGYSVWLTNTLGVGQSRSILITVRVNSPIDDLTQLTDLVALSTDQTGVYTTTESTLVQSPILALTKSANPFSPAANSPVTYTLNYTNSGSLEATNVIITDALPGNTSFVSCSGCTGPVGNLVTWNLTQISSQQSSSVMLTLKVNNNLPNGTVLTNTARISSTENVSAFTRLTSAIVSAPGLSLSIDNGVTSAAASDVLAYSLAYANTGNTPVQNVVITERIPSNVSFLNCSTACVSMGSGVYSFTIGTVAASSNQAVALSVKVNPTLPAGLRAITATAAIQTTTPGDDPADNFAQDVDTISTVPTLALGADFDSTTPYETKVITYTIRYTNTSAMDTTGVVIVASPSPFVTSLSSGWLANTISVGNLSAFGSGVVTYVVSLPMTFTQPMTAFVTQFTIQDDGPGDLPTASAVHAAVIGVPDLVIDSVSLSPGTVVANQKFTATVIIRNQGTGWACNTRKLQQGAQCPGGPLGTGGFYVDAFISPTFQIPSYPYVSDGNAFRTANPLGPGLTATIVMTNLIFAANQRHILYFKIDNYSCISDYCLPSSGKRGLIPESDEYNNVSGPWPNFPFKTYLPVMRK